MFVIRQAIDSPNVTQRIEEAAAEVEVPGKFIFFFLSAKLIKKKKKIEHCSRPAIHPTYLHFIFFLKKEMN